MEHQEDITIEQHNFIKEFAREWIKKKEEYKKRLPKEDYSILFNLYNKISKEENFFDIMSKWR